MSRIKKLEARVAQQNRDIDSLRRRLDQLVSGLGTNRVPYREGETSFEYWPGSLTLFDWPVNLRRVVARQYMIMQHLGLRYVPPDPNGIGTLEPVEQECAE